MKKSFLDCVALILWLTYRAVEATFRRLFGLPRRRLK